MPRNRKSPPPCRWWAHDDYFDGRSYYTDCSDGTALEGSAVAVAEAVWADASEWCPFCGGSLWYCEEDEVMAEEQAELDYREEVRHGSWM